MPELFIRCPTCEGKPMPSLYSAPAGCHNPLCDRGFVRYGTEIGHHHEWTISVEKTGSGKYDWTADALKPRLISCACGKTADEVTA